jgi:peptidoglycan glycosyltransferase
MMERQNKRIIHALIFVCLLFLSIVIYLTYFELFDKDKILSSSYNQRQWAQEDTTLRGRILDKNGVVLAYSTADGEEHKRVYPFGSLYSQIVGYNSSSYGKSLLEARYNNDLLNKGEFAPIINLQQKLAGEQTIGNDLYLTLDNKLQQKAEKLMGDRNGAVVVMQPKTGEILAMVSKPDFNPNSEKLADRWQDLIESEEHPFVPRAIQGLYVPGSTFKVLTAAAAVENGMGGRTFNDEGSIVIEGKTINNFENHAYGELDLKGALAVSRKRWVGTCGLAAQNFVHKPNSSGSRVRHGNPSRPAKGWGFRSLGG